MNKSNKLTNPNINHTQPTNPTNLLNFNHFNNPTTYTTFKQPIQPTCVFNHNGMGKLYGSSKEGIESSTKEWLLNKTLFVMDSLDSDILTTMGAKWCMEHINYVPCDDYGVYNTGDYNEIIGIIEGMLEVGDDVVVLCYGGKGRTGYVNTYLFAMFYILIHTFLLCFNTYQINMF